MLSASPSCYWLLRIGALLLLGAQAHSTPAGAAASTCIDDFRRLHGQLSEALANHPALARTVRAGNILLYPVAEPVRITGNTIAATYDLRNFAELSYYLAPQLTSARSDRNRSLWLLTVVGPFAVVEGGIHLVGKGANSDESLRQQLPDPKQGLKVFVEAVHPDNPSAGFEEALFKARYSQDPNAVFLRVNSIEDMKKKLASLVRERGRIGLLEINAHGSAGVLGFPDGRLTASKVGAPVEGLFLKDAGIRLVSCNVAREPGRFEKGSPADGDLLAALGKTFLSEGGKVAGSNRYIHMSDHKQHGTPGNWLVSSAKAAREILLAAPDTYKALTLLPLSTAEDLPEFLEAVTAAPVPDFRVVTVPGRVPALTR